MAKLDSSPASARATSPPWTKSTTSWLARSAGRVRSEPQTAVAPKEARDHAQARVPDNVPHQAQLQFRGQTRFLSGAGRPCRDEFGDGLQILACVLQDLAKAFGRDPSGRLGRGIRRLLRLGRYFRCLRSLCHFLEQSV